MKVRVAVGNHEFTALLDTGSTTNFISLQAAQQVGLQFHNSNGAQVIVANGDRVDCRGLARDVAIKIGQEEFDINCYSIPLDCFDMVLGMSFLKRLGPILWDLDDPCMAFWRQGRRVFWKGIGLTRWDIPPNGRLYVMSHSEQHLLDYLLQQFSDVFSDPTGLPPRRECDHRIHVKHQTEQVAVRPYRYPQLPKDEMEAQCETMLKQGIIRPSTSPFSVLVLLVKKQDGTWRFCVDYRALMLLSRINFQYIPVVEELLDELQGPDFSPNWI